MALREGSATTCRDGDSLLIRFIGLTDTGQKRKENEDCFLVSEAPSFGILADGMGGRLFGEVASSMAVEILARHLKEDSPPGLDRLDRSEQVAVMVNLLDEWFRDVNRAVHGMGVEDERYQDMGTTLVVLIPVGGQMILGNVGDSRCYRQTDGKLSQVSEDHSFVNSQLKSGMITEEEARESTQRNIITRAVGTAAQVKADIVAFPVATGDRLLLCSDGLTDMISDEQLEAIMGAHPDDGEAVAALVAAANEAGGNDNITVIVGTIDG